MPDMENGTKIIFFQKKNIFSKLLEDLKFTNNRYTIDASVYTKKGPLSSFYKEKNSKNMKFRACRALRSNQRNRLKTENMMK